MNYLVGIIIAVGLAVWLIGFLVKGIVSIFQDLAFAWSDSKKRDFSRYISIRKVYELDEYLEKIKSFEKLLDKNESWQPPKIQVEKFIPLTYKPINLNQNNVCSNLILINEFDEWVGGIGKAAREIILEKISQDCSFIQARPKVLLSGSDNFPDSIKTFDIAIPEATIDISGDSHRAIKTVKKLFAKEIEDFSEHQNEVEKVKKHLEYVKLRAANLNQDILKRRATFEKQRKEIQQKLDDNYEAAKKDYQMKCKQEKIFLLEILDGYSKKNEERVTKYFEVIFGLIFLPNFMPRSAKIKYDPNGGILIADIQIPDVTRVEIKKIVYLKNGTKIKDANKSETKNLIKKIQPVVLLKIAQDLLNADTDEIIENIAINGWVEFVSKETGQLRSAYVASVLSKRENIMELILEKIDPMAAFNYLKGRSAFVTDDVVPILPQLALNTEDSRFVQGREILSKIENVPNIATMPWEDFEHLIRELFEKLHEKENVEVKITQVSRDRGVDAVIFNPDPIKGGKTIVQAKRYVNTVDVSAVRDLYGTLLNEGAGRGILVTTSYFGPDAYNFAKDKPLTLINGTELISYLKEVGVNVRIDIAEARQIIRSEADI